VNFIGWLTQIERPRNLVPIALIVLGAWGFALFATKNPGNVVDAVTALGILAGGMWVAYQFVLGRAFESSVSIEPNLEMHSVLRDHLVSFDIAITNTGHRRIVVDKQLSDAQKAEYENSIQYPGDLQIKRIKKMPSPAFVGWWTEVVESVQGLPEHISLLYEYTDKDKNIDFFMEPKERYSLGVSFLLPSGDYLAKIVLVGTRTSASEYWSRIFHFRVPDLPCGS
jgi:hypothetical protein